MGRRPTAAATGGGSGCSSHRARAMNRNSGAGQTPLSHSSPWRLMRRTERRVLEGIRADASIRPGESVLVAVSGGPDSTALLLILASLENELGVELSVAHVDHGLRSPEGRAADAAYACELSA